MKTIIFIILAPFVVFGTDKEAIRSVVGDNIKQVKSCYEDSLKSGSNEGGKIIVDWSIDDKGSVIKASINMEKSSLKDTNVHLCVIEKIKTWKFLPAPKGQIVSISYPFSFSKRGY